MLPPFTICAHKKLHETDSEFTELTGHGLYNKTVMVLNALNVMFQSCEQHKLNSVHRKHEDESLSFITEHHIC